MVSTTNVRPGDTLTSIARSNGMRVEDLLAANPQLKNPNMIQAGATLQMPEKRAQQDRSARSVPPPAVSRARVEAALPRGPAPTQGPAPTTAAGEAAPAGSINQRVVDATKAYRGTDTSAGPDGGNLACAWAVNNILANAGLAKVGENTNYVPSVQAALDGGRGQKVDAQNAQPGDIVIFPGAGHIGIYMGDGKVMSNSSSSASFTYEDSVKSGMSFYRLTS